MLRNYLAAALSNLSRNRLYAGVTIVGLAIGFAAALLIGVFVRDEFSYDRFISGHERTYLVTQTIVMGSSTPIRSNVTPMMMARPLALDFPQIEAVARLSPAYFPPTVRRGDVTAGEQKLFWGDPGLFGVLPLPVVAGDLTHALDTPDSVVLTRAIARKYFGRDAPLGGVILIDRQPMRVTAVLEDLPSNSHLSFEIVASTRSPQSPVSQYEAINGPLSNTLATYVRLRPGADPRAVSEGLAAFLERRLPLGVLKDGAPIRRTAGLVPLAQIHMHPASQGAFKPPANPATIMAIGVVGVMIIVVAAINFVTLMTARAARRGVEVGVRKAAGARRRDLIVQFMGEALIYVLLAAVLGVALAELSLPAFNAFLQRTIALDYLSDPPLLTALVGVVLLTALLAGAYPALVVSAFRPMTVLKGGPAEAAGGGLLREGLVVIQFAVLIALVVSAITISRQTFFSIGEGMRLDTDQVMLIFSRPCSERIRDQMRALPGVRSAACASANALNLSDDRQTVVYKGGRIELAVAPVDFDFFQVFGLHPVAGRFFDRNRPADGDLTLPDANPPVVINQAAARRLGFSNPGDAVGATVLWPGTWDESQRRDTYTVPPPRPSQVIGVAPDFTLGSMHVPIQPTLYSIGRNLPPYSVGLVAKLEGARIPETLKNVDRIWAQVSGGEPKLQVFVDQFTLRLYIDTLIQGGTIALAAIIALAIASLGLFALSAYTTERRTKEIGVRKAMGASSADILSLLLWRFSRPVLIANLIAWPCAWLAMRAWLQTFAYRVDIAPWTFLAAGLGALLIAWAAVLAHALRVARAKPVNALRYE